ncbi:MAG: hypothetical protein AB8E82_03325 [Aureispira sp.]
MVLILSLNACENATTTDTIPDTVEPDTSTTEAPAESAVELVDLSNATIGLSLQNEQEDEFGMPKASLYLHNSVTEDQLFLADDVRGVEVEKNSYTSFGIPAEALLAIECYWAGGGTYYYVLVDNNVLTVYRGSIGEPHPEVEAPDPASQYEPFKRFSFYEHEVVEENL